MPRCHLNSFHSVGNIDIQDIGGTADNTQQSNHDLININLKKINKNLGSYQ